jgi:hypothetical protein
MKKYYERNCGQMSEQDQKVFRSVWCHGPGVPWSELTPLERMAVFFRSAVDKEAGNPALLADLASKFEECGPQVVEIDVADPDDVYPGACPVCGTDTNWDIKTFIGMFPEYKAPE